jgi:hypothetical protein
MTRREWPALAPAAPLLVSLGGRSAAASGAHHHCSISLSRSTVYGRTKSSLGQLGGKLMAKARGHEHESIKHRHKHFHVTHYLHQGENWGHLLSTHSHDHNHAGVDHVHIPHRDVEKEHRREAHVHDHARPSESPG